MKKYLKYLVLCLLVFVIGINNNVKAEKIASQDGYARCVYGGTVSDSTVSSNIAVVIRVYKDTDGVVRAYSKMRCSDTYNEMATGAAEMRDCSIGNYDDIFKKADKKLYPSFGEGGWKCPGKIWVDVVPQYPNNGGNISITERGGYTALSLNNDYSKTENSAVIFESDDDDTGDFMRIPSLSESMNDFVEEKEKGDLGDPKIIEDIFNWGNSDDDSRRFNDNVVDSCSFITDGVQQLLHKIFLYISIAGIILLVVLTAVSLVKVITASEDEALRNFFKGLWKRIICLIILLLLPTIVAFIIQIMNWAAPNLGFRSDNPLCNVTNE